MQKWSRRVCGLCVLSLLLSACGDGSTVYGPDDRGDLEIVVQGLAEAKLGYLFGTYDPLAPFRFSAVAPVDGSGGASWRLNGLPVGPGSIDLDFYNSDCPTWNGDPPAPFYESTQCFCWVTRMPDLAFNVVGGVADSDPVYGTAGEEYCMGLYATQYQTHGEYPVEGPVPDDAIIGLGIERVVDHTFTITVEDPFGVCLTADLPPSEICNTWLDMTPTADASDPGAYDLVFWAYGQSGATPGEFLINVTDPLDEYFTPQFYGAISDQGSLSVSAQ